MGPWLLDVNILLAWLWPKHAFHRDALTWLGSNIGRGWATCPFTETGFLRIVSSRSFDPLAPSLAEAHQTLRRQMKPESGHQFWPADLSCALPTSGYLRRVTGHQQITDAYLLALAAQNGGILVTRDRRIRELAPEGSPEFASLLILP
jgi:uncharacterized protein